MKTRSIPLRIDENLAERLTRAAQNLNVPRSVLLRTAICHQLDRLESGRLPPPVKRPKKQNGKPHRS